MLRIARADAFSSTAKVKSPDHYPDSPRHPFSATFLQNFCLANPNYDQSLNETRTCEVDPDVVEFCLFDNNRPVKLRLDNSSGYFATPLQYTRQDLPTPDLDTCISALTRRKVDYKSSAVTAEQVHDWSKETWPGLRFNWKVQVYHGTLPEKTLNAINSKTFTGKVTGYQVNGNGKIQIMLKADTKGKSAASKKRRLGKQRRIRLRRQSARER